MDKALENTARPVSAAVLKPSSERLKKKTLPVHLLEIPLCYSHSDQPLEISKHIYSFEKNVTPPVIYIIILQMGVMLFGVYGH